MFRMLRELQAEGMLVQIYEDRIAMGAAAGTLAAESMKQLLAYQEIINVIFAAAPSQNEMLAELAASDVDFSRVRAFHMDEYIGLPDGASQRFSRYLDDHIFGLVPFKEIYYLEKEGSRYEELLNRYPVDITLMGIGENGHIAFNDPHEAKFDDPMMIKCVALDEKCREQQVHDGCFEKLEDVPREAVTLTIPALMRAKKVICTVPGETKRQAVTRTVTGPVSEECPATIMRKMRNSVLLCDRDSGCDLL